MRCGGDIERRLDRLETRGVRPREKPFVPADNAAEQKMSFRDVIRYYRYLLSKPVLGRSEREVFSYIAGELYRLFFSPFGEFLGGKDRLVIIPDGPLSLIPFETLRTADGFYLAERFVVSYTPSLTVLEMIGRRGYSSGRKPLLGFGGAVYNAVTYKEDMVQSERHLRQLREEAVAAVSRGGNVRGAYSSMGIAGWSNLPGSLSEVRAIGELVPSSTVYTGGDVSEEFVKSLSRSGALAEYRQLHFATHGIVVPEIPELSAVVLSQQERAVALFFSDIRGFTSMSEKLEPPAIVSLLNRYFDGMGEVIYTFEGTLNKFIGDAIMAFYGAPVPQPDAAKRAVFAALEMRRRLAELNREFTAEGLPKLSIGMGLHVGNVLVGNIGSSRQVEYTVIGDAVNLCSRIESLTKEFSHDILISDELYQKVADDITVETPEPVAVKGKSGLVQVHKVICRK